MLQADFAKAHGLGNDYVVVDGARFAVPLTAARVRLLCHRHLGLGSDGVLEIARRPGGYFVRVWNPDGSEAERSGNGLRIAAKFLSEHGYVDDDRYAIATVAGPVQVEVRREGDRVGSVRLGMGPAEIRAARTPLDVGGEPLDVTLVAVGNPHCVVFGQPLTRERLFALGPRIESHAKFPERINVQLAEPLARDRVRALVWERGAGHTLASGTSACAVAAASFERGLVDRRVSVEMEGGVLEIEVDPKSGLVLTGPVEGVFTGVLSPDLRRRLEALA